VAGEFKKDKFQTNYGFLAEVHRTELNVLRDNLKRARKLMQNAPRHLKDDYEAETRRIELAVKRAESTVNKERMEGVQREALRKAAKDENEKRKQGKGSWYPKKGKRLARHFCVPTLTWMFQMTAEKRELVTHARYEALAAEGGKRAVKRAIEKKQKKISQREKRSRPLPRGGDEGVRKRRKLG
jgi:ribosomal RNA-processing protein 36